MTVRRCVTAKWCSMTMALFSRAERKCRWMKRPADRDGPRISADAMVCNNCPVQRRSRGERRTMRGEETLGRGKLPFERGGGELCG